MQAKTLQMSDGKTIAWREAGRGQPLLFIHGWSLDSRIFEYQLDALSDRYRVICPDLRGHGQSEPDASATIDRLISDIDELSTHLALSGAVAVGWSLGALILWKMLAGRRPNGIAALVSVDMSPMIHNDDGWQLGLQNGREPAATTQAAAKMTANWPRMVRQFVPKIFSPAFAEGNQPVVDDLIAIAEQNDVASMTSIWRSMAEADERSTLATIRVPSLVTFGRNSQLYHPETARFVAEAIPVSDLVEFTQSGHAPQMEEPDLFNHTIEVFARGVSGGEDRKVTVAIPN